MPSNKKSENMPFWKKILKWIGIAFIALGVIFFLLFLLGLGGVFFRISLFSKNFLY